MYRLISYAQPLATSAAYRSPWTGFDREINSLFSSALAGYAPGATRSIPVNLHEDKDNLQLTAELPGVAREDIKIEIVDDVLSLSATRKESNGGEEQSLAYTRSLTLPYAVQEEKVSATLKDGVLRVSLPKQEQAKPRSITIN